MTRPAGTYAIFETSQGNIVIKLLDKEAPKTVENFVGPGGRNQGIHQRKDGREGKAAVL